MKTYRIKRTYASILVGLQGLYMTPSECRDYVNVNVFDNQTLSNLDPRNRLARLPKKCDRELVYATLEQIQSDNATIESVKILREYLEYAEKKDKNNEIKSDIKKAVKQIFWGLLVMVVGGLGGFGLMFLLMSLWPVCASWASFILIPIVAALAYGAIKVIVGCLKLGAGVFSFCFRQKNVEQLTVLENALRGFCDQLSSLPPSYTEVMVNNKSFPSAPKLDTGLPSYEQAVKNIAALSAQTIPAMGIPNSAPLPGYSVHSFHHSHTFFSSGINDNPSPLTPLSWHCSR
ncbi:MAG: hypothetical protein WA659_03970 [Candidatus Aquirickettsiella sp.]